MNIDGEWWIDPDTVRDVLTSERVEKLLEAIKVNRSMSDSDHDRILVESLPRELSSDTKVIFALLVDLGLGHFVSNFVRAPAKLPVKRKYLNSFVPSVDDVERISKHQYHFIQEDMHLFTLYPKTYEDREMTVPFRAIEDSSEVLGAYGRVQAFSYSGPGDTVERKVLTGHLESVTKSKMLTHEVCEKAVPSQPGKVLKILSHGDAELHHLGDSQTSQHP